MIRTGAGKDETPKPPECPSCECRHAPVLYIRRYKRSGIAWVMRRRECRACGRRFSTIEKEIST